MKNLKELRALCDAATDGEWDFVKSDYPHITSFFAGATDIYDLYHIDQTGLTHIKDYVR